MKIKDVVDEVKAKTAYSKRRASAVVDHGRKVVTTGIDAAQTVASVAVRNLKATAQAQKATLTDSSLPIKTRLQKLTTETSAALKDAKAEVADAAKTAYQTVGEKLVRVTDVTHKEQALENKLHRKAVKAKKTAERLAAQL